MNKFLAGIAFGATIVLILWGCMTWAHKIDRQEVQYRSERRAIANGNAVEIIP